MNIEHVALYERNQKMKKIVIESLVLSQKTAIVEDDKLVELLIEDNTNEKIVSNIYRGVVKI